MLVCPTCGQKNREGALFCDTCGTYFHVGNPLTTEPLSTQPASKPGPSHFAPAGPDSVGSTTTLVLVDSEDGRRFVFDRGVETELLGRNDRKARLTVDIDLTGQDGHTRGVSRRHARLHYTNGNYLIEDLESLNGTYLNDRKLRPYLPEVLHEGDHLRLGDLTLSVSLEQATG